MRMLSIKSVAARVDVDPKTIRRWIADGEFPSPVYLPNGHLRWSEIVVDAWMATLPRTPKQAVSGAK